MLEEEEDQFGDMTAQLSGSQYAILKNQAEREVRSLTSKLKQHEIDQNLSPQLNSERERLHRRGRTQNQDRDSQP